MKPPLPEEEREPEDSRQKTRDSMTSATATSNNREDERDNDDRDVSEHIVQNAEEQDFEDQNSSEPEGNNAADVGVPRELDNVRLELFPDDVGDQRPTPPTQQLQSERAQQLPPQPARTQRSQQPPKNESTPPRRSGRQCFAPQRYTPPLLK